MATGAALNMMEPQMNSGLLSRAYAQTRSKLIDVQKAMPYPNWGDPLKFQTSEPVALLHLPPRPAGMKFNDDYEIEYDTTSFPSSISTPTQSPAPPRSATDLATA